MKINWGLVIALFLLVGIGAHMLRTVPVREHPVPLPVSRPADVPVREQVRLPDPAPRVPTLPLANEPIALPTPRPETPKPVVVKHKPQPKPKESNARPTYRRVFKNGALGGDLVCAKVRPLNESEKAAYEDSGERDLLVCLN